MYQVGNVSNRLQRDLGAVESAAPRSRAGRELFCTAFLAFLVRLRLVLVATRFIEDFLDFAGKAAHVDSPRA